MGFEIATGDVVYWILSVGDASARIPFADLKPFGDKVIESQGTISYTKKGGPLPDRLLRIVTSIWRQL